jgi:ribose transport system ATP-binding protein
MSGFALELEDVSLSFDGVHALSHLSLQIRAGEVLGIAGKNGAGKSSLMKLIQGIYHCQRGKLRFFGNEIGSDANRSESRKFVSSIFQDFSLVPEMTVAQNIYLGSEPQRGWFIDEKICFQTVESFFERMGISIDPREKVKNLGTSDLQLVEISKAVIRDKKILLMDEPTAALGANQVGKLFRLVSRLQQEGITIVFITHHLRDLLEVCDRIAIMRDGTAVHVGQSTDLTVAEIVRHMLGRAVERLEERRPARTLTDDSVPILEAVEISSRHLPKPISFVLRRGEVLGLAGLKGSGRTEILKSLFGVDPIESGEIKIKGRVCPVRSPKEAMKKGVALIPGNRQLEGLCLFHSLYFNAQLPWMDRITHGFFISDRNGKRTVSELVSRLQIKTAGLSTPVSKLSGGNQQKVVIAKVLATQPNILLMDDPTFGVDIQVKVEIAQIIDAFARAGNGVILVSSDPEELLHNCNRILIVKRAEIKGELTGILNGAFGEDDLEAAIQ